MASDESVVSAAFSMYQEQFPSYKHLASWCRQVCLWIVFWQGTSKPWLRVDLISLSRSRHSELYSAFVWLSHFPSPLFVMSWESIYMLAVGHSANVSPEVYQYIIGEFKGRVCICTYHQSVKERMWGLWNALFVITLPSEIPSLTLLALMPNVFQAACSPTQSGN